MRWRVEDRPRLKLVILERVEAGETVRAICAGAGFPCAETVTNWMAEDPDFGEALRAARTRARWLRTRGPDEAAARAVMARLREGVGLEAVLREPGMPSMGRWRHWLATQGWLQEEYYGLRAMRREENGLRLARRRRDFDPGVAERLYVRLWKGEKLRAVLRSDPAFPSLAVLARWRREQPKFDEMMRVVLEGWRRKRGQGRSLCTPELTAVIVDALRQGESLRSLSRWPGMPCQGALYAWVARRPDFAAAVARACDDREDWFADQIAEAALRSGATSQRALTRATAPLSRQITRLRKRPGWKGAR